ncbi:MAK10-like protein [Tanacetum coccineum]
MGDENPIRTLGDYSKPRHNVVPLRSDTIRLVQNGCSFHGLRSEDPNQHLKDFLKLVDSLDLDGSITTWEDLTTRFLAQFFPPGRTAKLRNDILMFQQHHGESLSEAWTRFKDSLQKFPHHGINLWLQVKKFYDHVNPFTRRTIDQSAGAIGPHDTQYCMEDPEQAFVEYASSRTDEAGEGLVSNFMASQDARLTKFEADFKQQQSEMNNKIDIVLKAITDRIAGALPSDTIKNPKLSTSPVLSARSYPTIDPQCSTHVHGSINAVTICRGQQSVPQDGRTEVNKEEEKDKPENIHFNSSTPPDPSVSFITEKVLKFNSFFESLGLVPPSSNTELVCTKEEDGDVMFIEIVLKDGNSRKEELEAGEQEVDHFDMFPTRSELAYHKYLMYYPIPSIFLHTPIIIEGCPSNFKIPCNIRHVHIMRRKLDPRENSIRGVSNFTGRIKGIHVFIGNFTYIVDFMIVEDISSIIDPRLSQVVLGRHFVEIYNMTHDPPEGVVRFINGTDEIAYKMPHKIEQYNSLSDLEKEHTKSVYLRNEEDKRRGVEY